MFLAKKPEAYAGKVVGSGHCVAFVQEAARAPQTSAWRAGVPVRSTAMLPAGVAIATFDPNGRYGSHLDGRSHAAILTAVLADGLNVWDQWRGRAVAQRVIRFRGGQGDAVNDGDAYRVIETEPTGAYAA